MDPLSSIEKGLSTVENMTETLANPAGSLAGEAVKAGENIVDGTSNTIVQTEVSQLNPFTVATGVTPGLLGTLEGKLSEILKHPDPFTDISKYIGAGSDNTTSDLGGSSIEAVLLQLAAKERDRLAGKVDQLKNLQAPGPNASAQDQSNFDTTKANLMADNQSIENSIQQITTMATNVQKNDNDTNMAIVRNIA